MAGKGVCDRLRRVQGYLTCKTTHPPRTLPQGYLGSLGGPSGVNVLSWARYPCSYGRPINLIQVVYRGTSLVRQRTPLGPYRRPMPRVLGRSLVARRPSRARIKKYGNSVRDVRHRHEHRSVVPIPSGNRYSMAFLAWNSCCRGAGRGPHTKPLHNVEATIMSSLSVKVRTVVLAAASRRPSVNVQFCNEKIG